MAKTNNINSKLIEFKCIPEICTFNSEDYKVYGVSVNTTTYTDLKINKYNNITLTGAFQTLGIGIEYSVKAFEESTKYGISYKVQNIRREKPTDLQSSRAFLYEIITHNQADVILAVYPDIVDRVIQNRLADIDLSLTKGIKDFTFNLIKEQIIENFALVDLCEKFKGVLTISILKKLYDKYPSLQQIEKKLRDDPYACLCGLARVGFRSADTLILELDKVSQDRIKKGEKPVIDFGYDVQTSLQREKACIMYLLEENENNGHTRMDIREVKSQSERLTPSCSEHFVDVIKNERDIHYDKSTLSLALKTTYETEKYIAERLLDGLTKCAVWDIDCSKYRKDDNGIELTNEQLSALECLCKNNLMVLNGSAGVGKSASTNAIIKMLRENGKSFRIFCPTGRAAKVSTGYTGYEAMTIHRGLGYRPPHEWAYNENLPLSCDVLIIDEFGMVDIFLFEKVLRALNFEKTKLVMIGDNNQIPSVSAGNVLHDILKAKIIPKVELTKVFRYGEGGLMTVATKTRRCEKFVENGVTEAQIFGVDKSYNFIPMAQERMVNAVKQLYMKLLSQGYLPKDILVLSSFNKGDYGTKALNEHLQPVANDIKNKQKFTYGETNYYEDDLVIQCVNNYKALVYIENPDIFAEPITAMIPNGEIGVVKKIIRNRIIVDFDGVLIEYSVSEMNQLKLAYSISIHKCQGGNARIVILLTPKAHTYMLNSNLIYVGQTRAREKVYHFGEPETINRAIKKKADLDRQTFLKELLKSNK